jgi:hypothetical protein
MGWRQIEDEDSRENWRTDRGRGAAGPAQSLGELGTRLGPPIW